MTQKNLTLGIANFTYADLYDTARLTDLSTVFDESIHYHDADLYARFTAYQQTQGADLTPEATSQLLVDVAPYLGKFVAKLFNISDEHQAQSRAIKDEIDTIFTYKNEVIEGEFPDKEHSFSIKEEEFNKVTRKKI